MQEALWGLAVTQSAAQALDLPVNDVVLRIEGGAKVKAHMHHTIEHRPQQTHYLSEVMEKMESEGADLRKPVLQFMLMTLVCGEASHESCWCLAAAKLDKK